MYIVYSSCSPLHLSRIASEAHVDATFGPISATQNVPTVAPGAALTATSTSNRPPKEHPAKGKVLVIPPPRKALPPAQDQAVVSTRSSLVKDITLEQFECKTKDGRRDERSMRQKYIKAQMRAQLGKYCDRSHFSPHRVQVSVVVIIVIPHPAIPPSSTTLHCDPSPTFLRSLPPLFQLRSLPHIPIVIPPLHSLTFFIPPPLCYV